MSEQFINITLDNLNNEHLCCAIGDKKHQYGVNTKKVWMKDRIAEGHVFRKLDEKGKVFIEYAPLETAWVPVNGDNYIYIYCLWVSGSFKGKGYAKSQRKAGVCILSSKKKKPFLSEKKFMQKYGFQVVDSIGEYEILALSFNGTKPAFAENVKRQSYDGNKLTIYYGIQCPYIPNCIEQIKNYCHENHVPLELMAVDSLEKAKNVPCVFNNWAVLYNGKFETVHLLNEGYLKKMLSM